MTATKTLQSYLSSQLNVKSPEFWDGLRAILEDDNCLNENLSQKAKLLLIEAIRNSVTCEEWKSCSEVITILLRKISDEPYFKNNFSEKDQSFFSTLSSFVSIIYGKSSADCMYDLKNEILAILDMILNSSEIMDQKSVDCIVRSIIVMFKNCDEEQSLYTKALSFLYHLINKFDSLSPAIQGNAQILFDAAKEIQSPKTQMQLFNILWIVEARAKEASFVHKKGTPFISYVHKIALKINNGIKSYIITLQFQNAKLPNGTTLSSGWIDIGISDLIICFDEKIITIPFDSIEGLDAEGTIMTIVLDESFKEFGDNPDHTITIKLSKKPTSKIITQVFSRVSRGESQPVISDHDDENASFPGPQEEIVQLPMQTPEKQEKVETPNSAQNHVPPGKNHTSYVQLPKKNAISPKPRNVKSSVAMYIAHDAQIPSYSSQIDENLFTDFRSSTNSMEPHKPLDSVIPDTNDDEQDSLLPDSPPPPSIDMNMSMNLSITAAEPSENDENADEEYDEEIALPQNSKVKKASNSRNKDIVREEKPQSRKPQYDIRQDDLLLKHTSIVSERICEGIDALTKQRMDCVDHFGQQIIHYVDSFKDDIRTAEKDKEHYSVKQLELSKQRFQSNIQQFKKKEASIQQTLAGIEEETKQFSSKITEIQRKMRSEIQKHRLDLEKQLKNLRKMIRKNDISLLDENDESSDLNDEYEDFIPRARTKFQITA